MNCGKCVLAGFAAGVVIFIVSMVFGTLTQAAFKYDVMELGGMRARDDPMMLLFLLHPFVLGCAMAVLYKYAGKAMAGSAAEKGIKLGLLMWVVYGIPSAYVVFTSMNYPLGFTVNSVVGSLFYSLAGGFVIARLFEPRV